jgi:CMP-N,N'-diacetyllegionaminic acid synthase
MISDTDVVVVAARKGSIGIPGKNKLIFDNTPLYLRTLKQALRISKNVIFSSDDEEMIEGSADLKNLIVIKRPKKLSESRTPKLPVLRHALDLYSKEYGLKPNFLIDLQTTSPLRLDKEILESYSLIKRLQEYQNLISITKSIYHPSYNQISLKDNKKAELLIPSKTITGREMLSNNYLINGSIFIWKYSEIMKEENGLIRKMTLGYETNELTSVDIDTELDFIISESILKSSFYKNFISSK